MAKPFDATMKELLESDPRAWMELLLGRELGDVRILNVDLSTITTEADLVLLVAEVEPWLVHLEFQSSYDPTLPLRLQRYNILVNYRHRLPVQSMALLLCPDADGPAMTGLLQQKLPDGLIYHEFRYNVVRTWERPADEILAGGLATLPLAPLARVKENELPTVIHAMQERLDREATKNQAETLWTATYILMGLKYSDELIDRLLEGVQNMKESVTYQKILGEGRAEGRAEEAKRILKRLGCRRFGKHEPLIEAAIDAIADLDRLEQLSDRVLEVTGWEELLAQP
jgi:predicted transposase YdaD